MKIMFNCQTNLIKIIKYLTDRDRDRDRGRDRDRDINNVYLKNQY
jgi:hypothetical protein